MAGNSNFSRHEKFVIIGDVGAPSFVPWIKRHAGKLGLTDVVCQTSDMRVEFEACGPVEMMDAMVVGCLLGPIDVWVEEIQRSSMP